MQSRLALCKYAYQKVTSLNSVVDQKGNDRGTVGGPLPHGQSRVPLRYFRPPKMTSQNDLLNPGRRPPGLVSRPRVHARCPCVGLRVA